MADDSGLEFFNTLLQRIRIETLHKENIYGIHLSLLTT